MDDEPGHSLSVELPSYLRAPTSESCPKDQAGVAPPRSLKALLLKGMSFEWLLSPRPMRYKHDFLPNHPLWL